MDGRQLKFCVIGRHRWVTGALITESVEREEGWIRRYTATIRGFRNWKIWQGECGPDVSAYVISTVKAIRDRIDAGDEAVFYRPNEYATTLPRERGDTDSCDTENCFAPGEYLLTDEEFWHIVAEKLAEKQA